MTHNSLPPSLQIEGRVATIVLQRPDVANRLEPEDLDALLRHIRHVNTLPDVMVLRITGRGKYFCSGYNIGSLGSGAGSANFGDVTDALEQARPITIAAINGGVYGGATDLALACDFRLGVQGCNMFVPAARLGLHFYEGGLTRYVSRLGLDTAKRVLLACETLDDQQMLACGFLTQLVAPDQLMSVTDSLSEQLAQMAPLALLNMKKHLNGIANGTLDRDELQSDIARADASEDLQEGGRAWKEKRAPLFKGR